MMQPPSQHLEDEVAPAPIAILDEIHGGSQGTCASTKKMQSTDEISEKEIPNTKLSFECLEINPINSRKNPHLKKAGNWVDVLLLAYQSIGVVFGDIGTSPLYVLKSTFPDGIKHNDDLLGVLSMIFYTMTFITLIKYMVIALQANDNGEGGTFALYSLLCKHAEVGMIPTEENRDSRLQQASWLKSKLENSKFARFSLLLATMLGTALLIGDGILTPCISVLSAVEGINKAASAIQQGTIVWISVAILMVLFMIQRFGTDKVGYLYAPILCLWFISISIIGVYNTMKYDPSVLKAVNPIYILDYFKRNKKDAWVSLGGTILCVTGAEALFADVGHFSVRSIQISTCFVTYPAILLAYTGQISYLRKHHDSASAAFYDSIPELVYWPMFVVAILAAIIASQSLISGVFSIIKQSLALGFFPRVKVVHTSPKHEGQVYVPEINYFLMVACMLVTIGFENSVMIGNAYGIAVVMVMVLTSVFLVLIMIIVWKTNTIFIFAYVIIIGSIELLYLSAVVDKFGEGGYLPLAFAFGLMSLMVVWNKVHREIYFYELDNQLYTKDLRTIVGNANLQRNKGLAFFHVEPFQGIPPVFRHYLANISTMHSVVVFVSLKSLPIREISTEERFLFNRVLLGDSIIYQCVVRYGYTDVRSEDEPFEKILVDRLKEFIRQNFIIYQQEEGNIKEVREEEIAQVNNAWDEGVVHLVADNEVIANSEARIWNRILINHIYNFIKRNLSDADKILDIPQSRMLKVGMTYEL